MKIRVWGLGTVLVLLGAVLFAATGIASRKSAVAQDSQPSPTIVLASAEKNTNADKQQWGDLSGRFLFGGQPPQRTKVNLNKDVEFCSKDHPLTNSLVVDPKSGGIANVVVWLRPAKQGQLPPIHESYAKTAKAEVVVSNDKCLFKPHVCVMRTSQTLLIKNLDSIDHNTAAFLGRNLPFNSVTAAGASDKRSLRKSERKPAKISCSIHSWMNGWLMVQDHPYVAVSDKQGQFTIKHLPAGEWTFQVWHEIPGYVKEVSTSDASKKILWEKGRVEFTVAPGENKFGEWVIAGEQFE